MTTEKRREATAGVGHGAAGRCSGREALRMDLSNPASLISGLLIGLVGMALLIYGKKQQRAMPALAGLALCVIPYCIASVAVLWLVTGACLGGLFVANKYA